MKNKNDKNFGQVIKILRIASGLKQKDLAEKVGVKPHYLSLVETGKRDPSLNIVRSIAEALNVPVSYLFWEMDGIPVWPEAKERNLFKGLSNLLLEMEKNRLLDSSKQNE